MQATASEAAKPSQASVVVRPDAAPGLLADKQEAGDSSPELNVNQGFLSADPLSSSDRPFQRGQGSQQHETLAVGPTGRAGETDAKGQEIPRRSSKNHHPECSKDKEASRDPAGLEAKHDRDRSGIAKGTITLQLAECIDLHEVVAVLVLCSSTLLVWGLLMLCDIGAVAVLVLCSNTLLVWGLLMLCDIGACLLAI